MNESAIEKAADAVKSVAPGITDSYALKVVNAVLPHLSVWEEPTEREEESAFQIFLKHRGEGTRVWIRKILDGFVAVRSASPVDPLYEAALKLAKVWDPETAQEKASEIVRMVAAIDKAKEK